MSSYYFKEFSYSKDYFQKFQLRFYKKKLYRLIKCTLEQNLSERWNTQNFITAYPWLPRV